MSFGYLTPDRAQIMRERYYEQQGIKKEIWPEDDHTKCLHDMCPHCGGTGIRGDGLGMCVHGISCSCRKCSVRC